MNYLVLAKQHAGSSEQVVYRTANGENASAFAESHFINRSPQSVRAVLEMADRVTTLKDRNGRPYVWSRF